uniref:Uncharacterized protein AlNc14C499G11940 n=1 Tax=Albugo laibachii Nc14 TaxID=890382 RepID=F0X0J5_9STRA|nr:conserved hypothetical protein [Albugo laibachii Nc14]|eukprot:CCA27286.1 conserved hypothetical protein [Albugo laibachii Nc14]
MSRKVLCRYFFQQTMVEDQSGIWKNSCSSFLVSSDPTLHEIQQKFPFVGEYHFRLQSAVSGCQVTYIWLDLVDPAQKIRSFTSSDTIYIKVLQILAAGDSKQGKDCGKLTPSSSESQELQEFFQPRLRNHTKSSRCAKSSHSDHNYPAKTVFDGVKNLTSKVMQCSVTQTFQKHSQKVWDKVVSSNLTAHSVLARPTASASAQLVDLSIAAFTSTRPNNAEHVKYLERLWNAGSNQEPFQLRGSSWSRLGFQTDDPFCEAKVLLQLQCLVYFLEVHHSSALTIINEQSSRNQNHLSAYSLPSLALRTSQLLCDILMLHEQEFVGVERPYWCLFESNVAFFELASILFLAFDRSWRAQVPECEEIGLHLDTMANSACGLLRRGPRSVASLVDIAHSLQILQ